MRGLDNPAGVCYTIGAPRASCQSGELHFGELASCRELASCYGARPFRGWPVVDASCELRELAGLLRELSPSTPPGVEGIFGELRPSTPPGRTRRPARRENDLHPLSL